MPPASAAEPQWPRRLVRLGAASNARSSTRSAGSRVSRPLHWCAATASALTAADHARISRASISTLSLAHLRPRRRSSCGTRWGLVDALTREQTAGKRLDDGLPESLEEVIAAYGHRYFKLKVSGAVDADIERLSAIAAVLDRIRGALFHHPRRQRAVRSCRGRHGTVDGIGEAPRLARLKSSMLVIEQPIGRARALEEPVHALARLVPMEVDESDADIDRVSQGAGARLPRHLDEVVQGFLSRRCSTGPALPTGTRRRAASAISCRRRI